MVPLKAEERMCSCVGENCTLNTWSQWRGRSSKSFSSVSDHTYQMRERRKWTAHKHTNMTDTSEGGELKQWIASSPLTVENTD